MASPKPLPPAGAFGARKNLSKIRGSSSGGRPGPLSATLKISRLFSRRACSKIGVPAGVWTVLNQLHGAKEPLPMIESQHNNLTPQKEQNWDARSQELLGILLNGGEFKPNELKPAANPVQ